MDTPEINGDKELMADQQNETTKEAVKKRPGKATFRLTPDPAVASKPKSSQPAAAKSVTKSVVAPKPKPAPSATDNRVIKPPPPPPPAPPPPPPASQPAPAKPATKATTVSKLEPSTPPTPQGGESEGSFRARETLRLVAKASENMKQGETSEAVQNYGRAAKLNPKSWELYNNLGAALRADGNLEAAAVCYRRGLLLKPDHAAGYSNLGNTLREQGLLSESMSCHQQAIRLAPKNADVLFKFGLALRDLNEGPQAMGCFDTVLQLQPDHVEGQFNRAMAILQFGDLEEGFLALESRWAHALEGEPKGKPEYDKPKYDKPEWKGEELKGKTILVHAEQTVSEMLQFARYLPMLKAKGGIVIVQAREDLAALMSAVEGVDKVVVRGAELPRFDVYIPMMSLARVFQTTLTTIPLKFPYLKAAEAFSVQLPATMENRQKVGIFWSVTSRGMSNQVSVPFTGFIELMGLPGVSMYSLQTGPAVDDINENGCEVLVSDFGNKVTDFADLAAAIDQLDLVVAVNSTVAHLAGAMGKPVWLILPKAPDWHWRAKDGRSIWYPNVRIFRHDKSHRQGHVFALLRHELAKLSQHRNK